jgi:hypothetical protein
MIILDAQDFAGDPVASRGGWAPDRITVIE